MTDQAPFTHLLCLDIDGLRHDVFQQALSENKIPNIARLLGGSELTNGLHIPIVSQAPSITFCAQASLFTGTHPAEHGIPGNQFFDRFGRYGNGTPRHYAFDVGDTLAIDDAVRVFTDGLAAQCLQAPTLYERAKPLGWRSVVAGNMYANGADTWIKPSLIHLARFTKGGNLFGMSSEEYDRAILDSLLQEIDRNGMPEIVTIHFLGLDKESHKYGPKAQLDYLVNHIDQKIGELWQKGSSAVPGWNPLVTIFSDHGQIEVIPDDRHSLRLSFPFERELGHLFDALGLDVHDYPGEDPNCDAVVASNGGLAFVYLQNRTEHWYDPPRFDRDVLSVAHAFWEAHQTGRYAPEIQGSLSGILLRNVERDGWFASYEALTPDGRIVSLQDWFDSIPDSDSRYADAVNRLNRIADPMTGDLILISNYDEGFYFGAPITGTHGGLHSEDSFGMLAFGYPTLDASAAITTAEAITSGINARRAAEGGRLPSTVDLMTGIQSLIPI